MPRLGCNGFSMFAASWRAELEAEQGRRLAGMEELMVAATPLWAAISADEKRQWKERAKEYKRTDEFSERKRAFRRRGAPEPAGQQRGRPLPDEDEELADEEEDYDDDFDPGVPMLRRPIHPQPRGKLAAKAAQDAETLDRILSGLSLEEVKQQRWLLVAVETYGPETGEAVAELALVEWSLEQGILEEYHRLIGPTVLPAEQAEDAGRLAARSHGIPLEPAAGLKELTMSRRGVLRNVLGRCEPELAWEKGLRLGMYKTERPRREQLLASAEGGRRLLLCPAAEVARVRRALETLCGAEELVYDGFPLADGRYLQLEQVVEQLGAVSASLPADKQGWAGRGKELLGQSSARWDHLPALHCSFHQHPAPNRHCALANARKHVFGLFQALRLPYNLPFNL